jgi:hypothetical protein
VEECLLSKHEALNSNPSTVKTKTKTKTKNPKTSTNSEQGTSGSCCNPVAEIGRITVPGSLGKKFQRSHFQNGLELWLKQ